jgi:hypothetical protein
MSDTRADGTVLLDRTIPVIESRLLDDGQLRIKCEYEYVWQC